MSIRERVGFGQWLRSFYGQAQGQVGLLPDTPSLPLRPCLLSHGPSGAQIAFSQNQLKRYLEQG